jgi:hypothetical protein
MYVQYTPSASTPLTVVGKSTGAVLYLPIGG